MTDKVKRAILDVTWENLPDLALPEGVQVLDGEVSLRIGGVQLVLEGDGLPDDCAGVLGSGLVIKTINILTTKIQAAGVDTVFLKDSETGESKPVHRIATEPFFIARFERWE